MSNDHPSSSHITLRLTPSQRRGWRYELSRGGIGLFLITIFLSSLMLCDCGVVPFVVMTVFATLPFIFGTRLQRIVGVICLAFAIVGGVSTFRYSQRLHERAMQMLSESERRQRIQP